MSPDSPLHNFGWINDNIRNYCTVNNLDGTWAHIIILGLVSRLLAAAIVVTHKADFQPGKTSCAKTGEIGKGSMINTMFMPPVFQRAILKDWVGPGNKASKDNTR